MLARTGEDCGREGARSQVRRRRRASHGDTVCASRTHLRRRRSRRTFSLFLVRVGFSHACDCPPRSAAMLRRVHHGVHARARCRAGAHSAQHRRSHKRSACRAAPCAAAPPGALPRACNGRSVRAHRPQGTRCINITHTIHAESGAAIMVATIQPHVPLPLGGTAPPIAPHRQHCA